MGYRPVTDFVNEKFGKGSDEPVFVDRAAANPLPGAENEANQSAEGPENVPAEANSEDEEDA